MDGWHEPDERLMARVADGERRPLDVLVRRHATAVLTFIQRVIGDRHRAEELFQEVFLTVWVRRRWYDTSRPFRPWLLGIAANKCRAELRRRRPLVVDFADEAADPPRSPGPSPLDTAILAERGVLVEAALSRISDLDRTVVVLRIWNGLDCGQIAEALDCSESTVRVHMFRGLKEMRRYLEPRMR
jgi:RNA polymerase sigma-70 factor, ECF subfamily